MKFKIVFIKFLLFFSLAVANESLLKKLAQAAFQRTQAKVEYNGQYFNIDYPNGDIPKNYGVCTDVVIRSYRALGIDLQRLVHEDMDAHFSKYPSKKMWGLNKTDPNIDHRRVPNLRMFFSRKGKVLRNSLSKNDYQAGDLVTWNLSFKKGNLPHIGVVSEFKSVDGTPLIVHNIGNGVVLENVLFRYTITGHYRYKP